MKDFDINYTSLIPGQLTIPIHLLGLLVQNQPNWDLWQFQQMLDDKHTELL